MVWVHIDVCTSVCICTRMCMSINACLLCSVKGPAIHDKLIFKSTAISQNMVEYRIGASTINDKPRTVYFIRKQYDRTMSKRYWKRLQWYVTSEMNSNLSMIVNNVNYYWLNKMYDHGYILIN